MPTGIRFPAGLRPPDRDGYEDALEEARTDFQPDVGAKRRRNKYRSAPTLFNAVWMFTQAEYYSFDYWVQYTIAGGALPFDIQLLDDDQTLVWYTVNGVGQFSYEIVNPEGELRYRTRWQLRAKEENFGEDRPAGTDELIGRCLPGTTLVTGKIKVYSPIRGATAVGVSSARARMGLPPLRGLATVGMYQLPRARLDKVYLYGVSTPGVESAPGAIDIAVIHYYPEDSRQWQNYDWLGTIAAQDINTDAEVVQREWMEI